jgi:metal-responsive CopG/Arc/MetJ family transcriptional regulator
MKWNWEFARPVIRLAGFALKEKITMTAITVTIPPDVLKVIDELREREFLSRSSWLRREIVLAVRASRLDETTETRGNA